jgi:hypothetical protein
MVSCSSTHNHCSLRVRIQRSAQPLVSGAPRKAASSAMPSQPIEPRKWPERYCVPSRGAATGHEPHRRPAGPSVDDRVVDRLQGGKAVPDLGHLRPRLGGVVVDAGKDPHPAVNPGPGHGRVRAPAQVRPLGDDRAVVGPRLAPTTNPPGCQQPFPPEQVQHPLAADVHAVLATQPSADLALPLPGERRGDQDLADQAQQLLSPIGGTGPGRPGPATDTAARVNRGAGRIQHPADHGQWQLVGHGYLGRFAGGIWTPLFEALLTDPWVL